MKTTVERKPISKKTKIFSKNYEKNVLKTSTVENHQKLLKNPNFDRRAVQTFSYEQQQQ